MRRWRIPKLLVIGPIAIAVAGCAGGATEIAAPPIVEAPPPAIVEPEPIVEAAPQPTPGLTARERFQLAINLLQNGDSAQAGAELHAYLDELPNSAQAADLLAQIETPIESLYPAENFTVELARDETLSSLAGIYLGDVLGFYGLARYNGIENPARVSEGQSIRIPTTPESLAGHEARLNPPPEPIPETPEPVPAAPPAAAPTPAQVAADPWTLIRGHIAAGRFEAAIEEAETSRFTPDPMQAILLASAYNRNARAIQATNAQGAAAQAFRAGQLYLETADRPEDAMASLELAVALDPADAQAQMLLATVKIQIVDMYYRTGVAAFQRQDLDGAIAAYDRALSINPDHGNAQVNRLQALELKQNLERLQ